MSARLREAGNSGRDAILESSSKSAANQEIGGMTRPVAVGTIMKQSTALRNTKLKQRAYCRGRVRTDEQHEQSPNDHERRRT